MEQQIEKHKELAKKATDSNKNEGQDLGIIEGAFKDIGTGICGIGTGLLGVAKLITAPHAYAAQYADELKFYPKFELMNYY